MNQTEARDAVEAVESRIVEELVATLLRIIEDKTLGALDDDGRKVYAYNRAGKILELLEVPVEIATILELGSALDRESGTLGVDDAVDRMNGDEASDVELSTAVRHRLRNTGGVDWIKRGALA